MLSLTQGILVYKNSAKLPFGLQSYSFVENYMNSLSQGVFDCRKIAELPFG